MCSITISCFELYVFVILNFKESMKFLFTKYALKRKRGKKERKKEKKIHFE
jgi:hypothetical protein